MIATGRIIFHYGDHQVTKVYRSKLLRDVLIQEHHKALYYIIKPNESQYLTNTTMSALIKRYQRHAYKEKQAKVSQEEGVTELKVV